ncbi:MAG: hypothetical protein R3D55_28640, partial [Chloroflexota bacterium]
VGRNSGVGPSIIVISSGSIADMIYPKNKFALPKPQFGLIVQIRKQLGNRFLLIFPLIHAKTTSFSQMPNINRH